MFGLFTKKENSDQKKLTPIQVAKVARIQEDLKGKLELCRKQGFDVAFVINKEKRSVYCHVHDLSSKATSRNKIIINKAVCAPEDRFVTPVGQIIALYRAMGKKLPSEYLHF